MLLLELHHGLLMQVDQKEKVVKSSHSSSIIKLGPTNPCRGCAQVESGTAGGLEQHSWRFRLPQLDIMITTAGG